jgi:hypothetical protein
MNRYLNVPSVALLSQALETSTPKRTRVQPAANQKNQLLHLSFMLNRNKSVVDPEVVLFMHDGLEQHLLVVHPVMIVLGTLLFALNKLIQLQMHNHHWVLVLELHAQQEQKCCVDPKVVLFIHDGLEQHLLVVDPALIVLGTLLFAWNKLTKLQTYNLIFDHFLDLPVQQAQKFCVGQLEVLSIHDGLEQHLLVVVPVLIV